MGNLSSLTSVQSHWLHSWCKGKYSALGKSQQWLLWREVACHVSRACCRHHWTSRYSLQSWQWISIFIDFCLFVCFFTQVAHWRLERSSSWETATLEKQETVTECNWLFFVRKGVPKGPMFGPVLCDVLTLHMERNEQWNNVTHGPCWPKLANGMFLELWS